MKLYIIEAPVKEAATPYWARTWTTSQSEAAAIRARYTSDLGVARKDIRTSAVEVDTRREALIPFLNKISNTVDGYAFGD